MPRKGWKAPEPRDQFIRIYCTKAEYDCLEAKRRLARVALAVFVREVALGTFLPGRTRTVTIDALRFARLLGALHALGAALIKLVDLLRDNEDPRHEHWSAIEARLSVVLGKLEKVLDGQ